MVTDYIREQGDAVTALEMSALRAATELSRGGGRDDAGFGDLAADCAARLRAVQPGEWIVLHGMPVMRPSRVAADLLADKEDPEAVAQVIADALRPVYDYPAAFADALAPYAASFGLRRGDGLALLHWLLDTAGDPETPRWMEEARTQVERSAEKDGKPPARPQAGARRR